MLQLFEVRINCITLSTTKERLESEIKDFLERELMIELQPDSKIEDYFEVYSAD